MGETVGQLYRAGISANIELKEKLLQSKKASCFVSCILIPTFAIPLLITVNILEKELHFHGMVCSGNSRN